MNNLSYDNLLDTIKQLREDKQNNQFINKKQNLIERINQYNTEDIDTRNLLRDIKDYLESKEEYNAGYNDGYEEGIDLD